MRKLFLTVLMVISLAVLVLATQVNLSIMHTSDIHGNIFPVDYATGKSRPSVLRNIDTSERNEKKQCLHTRHRYWRSYSGYTVSILLCESG